MSAHLVDSEALELVLQEVRMMPTNCCSQNFEDEAVFVVDHEVVPSLSTLWESNVALRTTLPVGLYDDDDDESDSFLIALK